nr:MAG TPA: hypothetical protein [Caudoviricetes sp.]
MKAINLKWREQLDSLRANWKMFCVRFIRCL